MIIQFTDRSLVSSFTDLGDPRQEIDYNFQHSSIL
jgi:hypothetical protein